ncbi:hypothetical protein AVEN_165720-1 [Araneus ventricosus]|uniref:Gustatory receptor n=1 Tax=Araneus ventricosus TaxID=182803 RepID=A0A4Y2C5I8_ARAVE|nr:hypothetical protein AVEN_165720-1 [Araneus ventricosus]
MSSFSFDKKTRNNLQKFKDHEKSFADNFKIYPQLILREQNSTESSWNPLAPFLTSLFIFGLYISEKNETIGKCRKILRFIHLAIIAMPMHYWTILYLSYFFRSEGSWKIFSQTLVIGTAVATLDIAIYRKKEIEIFIRYFTVDKVASLRKAQKRKYLRWVRIFNAVIWIYVLLWMATFLIIPTKKKPEEHFTEFFYHHVVNKTSHQFGKYLIQVNDAYLCLMTEGSITSIIGLYISSVCASSLWFKKMGESVKQFAKSQTLNPLDLNHLQRLYDQLLSRIILLDTAFSLSVLLWYFMVMLTLCIRVIAIIGETDSQSDIQGMLIIGFGLFRGTFIILIGIAFCAQYLTDTAKAAVLKIEILTVSTKNSAAYQELTILLRMLELKPPIVTLWNFCAIGKPFLMSCVQTMVTYVIICLQMTPAGKTLLHI